MKFLLVMVVLLMTACSRQPAVKVEHVLGQTMGTTYNVKFPEVAGVDEAAIKSAIDKRLVQVNKLMSTYDPTSELSRFNQYRFAEPFTVSDETLLVVNEAL
ncbi:MAG: FAD:protein FMN transferase ApbE, partial [Alteromonadaceae bacterium]|nr:FAD:protein FMN transferase ApbE [Alteromonadaceae bacterium]